MRESMSERELYGEVCRIGSAIGSSWPNDYRVRNAIWYAAIEHDLPVLRVAGAVMQRGSEYERAITNALYLGGSFAPHRRPVIIAGDGGVAA